MCPFAPASKSGRERTMRRFADDPQHAVAALALEHLAVSRNDRQGLAAGARAVRPGRRRRPRPRLARLQEHLDVAAHALYEVRRILRARGDDPGKLANASRHLRVLATGSCGVVDRQLRVTAARLNADVDDHDGIRRAWLKRRSDGLPARAHFLVAAPAGRQAQRRRALRELVGAAGPRSAVCRRLSSPGGTAPGSSTRRQTTPSTGDPVRTTSIQSGDVVLVDKRGDRFLAIVNAKTPHGLQIAPVERRVTYRTARPTEVHGHWARRARTPHLGTPVAIGAAARCG